VLTIPYNFDPQKLNNQALRVLQHPARFQVLNWHRKARKTTLAINNLIRWAASHRGVFWYVSPSYQLAKKTIWYEPEMLPKYMPYWHHGDNPLFKKKETDLTIEFKASGGQIHIYGADRPDLMRGPNPMGVVLDEFSRQKKQVWDDIVQPIMRANPKNWTWFLFTPFGKNHAFDIYQYGEEERAGEWKSWKLTVEDSGIFDKTQMENMRLTSTAQTFSQEYMCEFLEGEGSVFRAVRDVCMASPERPVENHNYVMGVDLAKHIDYTVITVYDRATNAQVYQDRFQRIDWPFQKAKIKAVSDLYNHALVILDATGIGDPIYDDLARINTPVQEFKITNESKKDLIENLSIKIEQRQVKMINMQETLFEFDNFAFEVLPSGRIVYGAPEGFHDDIVISHALAVWGLQPVVYRPTEQPKTRIQRAYERAKMGEAYEQRLIEKEWADIN